MLTQSMQVLLNLDLDKVKPVQFLEVTSKHFCTLDQAIIDAAVDKIDETFDLISEITCYGQFKDDYEDACIFFEHVDALRLDMLAKGIEFDDGLRVCVKNFLASGAENYELVKKVALTLTDLRNGAHKLYKSSELGFAVEARACLFLLGCLSTKDSALLVYDHASFVEEILCTYDGVEVGSENPLTTISALYHGVFYNCTSKFMNNYRSYRDDIDLITVTTDLVLERDSDNDGVFYDTLYVLEP